MSNADDIRKAARERQRKFRAKHKTFTVSFERTEARELERLAGSKGYAATEYLKELTKQDLHGTGYVLPRENNLVILARAISHIGHNINQLTRYVHAERGITKKEVRQFQQLLTELHFTVTQTLSQPENITTLLSQHLERCPEDLQRLRTWMYDYKEDTH